MRSYPGIDPSVLREPLDARLVRQMLLRMDQYLRELDTATGGEVNLPVTNENKILSAVSEAIPIALVEAIPGKSRLLRGNSSGHAYVHVTNSPTIVLSEPISVDDNGASLTVDGSITADTELPAAVAHDDNITLANAPNVIAASYARDEGATTHSQVSGELSSVDTEAGNDGDFGKHVSDIVKNYAVDLTDLNDTYDDAGGTQTNTSAAIDVRRFRWGEFNFQLLSSGSPTDILFTIWFSDESGGTYRASMQGAWCNLLFDDTICVTTAIHRSYPFEITGNYMKVTAYATGLSAAKWFAVGDVKLILKN